MNEYKWKQVALISFFSVTANLLGRFLAGAFVLPFWLDSFGTFLTAYCLGPWCGIIVGVAGNILEGLSNPLSLVYSLTSICIAVMTGCLAKRGWMSSLLKTVSLSVLITLACVVVSCSINFLFYGGKIANIWGQGISEMTQSWGVPFPLAVIMGQFYVEFLDKVVTLCAVYAFIHVYRLAKKFLPSFLKPEELPKVGAVIFAALALSAFGAQKAFAQTKDYNSYVRIAYNKENALPGGKANDIATTNDGILWIGTYEGLYRHNGHEFRLMSEFDSIKAARSLYVDDEGRLFVGTNDNGLSIVINETVANTLEEKDGLPSASVRCVTRGSNGLYYVGTSEDMAILSISDGLAIQKLLPQIQSAVRVTADPNENVCAVTVSGGLFLIHGDQIVWSSKNFGEKFTAATFAPDGLLYASTESNRVLVFAVNGEEGAYRLEQERALPCGRLRHINSINFFDDVTFLCADNGAGYIEDGGFYEIETGAFNNSIDNMTEDYQGNFWFTSSRLGLLKLCGTAFSEIYSTAGLPEAVVNSVARFKDNLYFATDDGLTAIDAETNRPLENALTKSLSNTRIRCLTTTKAGDMWICTKSKGLILAERDGGSRTYETGRVFRAAIELDDGTIAAGSNDGVLFIKDKKPLYWLGEKDGLENSIVLNLTQSHDGSVLAGTDGGGIAVIQKSLDQGRGEEVWKIARLIKRSDGLSSNVILRTVNDYDGHVPADGFFAITSNGLCYVKKDGADYKVRPLSNFPFFNNYDMIIRRDKNVFVLSSAGIFVVNRDELLNSPKLDYELLDLKKGLRGSLTSNSWNFLDHDGNLYLCCDSGSSRINLNTYNKSKHSYRIQLKSVLVDGKRHIVQKDTPFVIPAESDKVEILPEIINYSVNNPFLSLYMEGIDESPNVMLQSDLSSLIYTNLKAGTYNLRISVLDSKGLNVTEESVYKIIKAFHFYDNWWFMLYTVGVFVLAIAWLTWFLTSTLLRRRMEKQAKEMEEIQRQIRIGNETIFSIANAVEARDKSTGKHSFRVAEYSLMIARELGFSQKELDAIHKTGLLHDIGKIGVPDSILNKPDRLTPEEYAVMKTHVNIGGEILKDFTLVERVAEGAKFHHERYDGTGYPNGLKGEEIPLNARIIGIADAFDAMTANRVYRKAKNMDYVVAELKRCSGTQFDPGLVEIMLELIESGSLNVSKTVEASAKEISYEQ